MALTTVCKTCRKRSAGALNQCPRCDGVDLRFIADYWPHGRNGRRIYQPLPESVTTATSAREIEALLAKTRKKKAAAEPIRPKGTLVTDLFPKYLDDYSEIYHRPSTHTDINSCYHAHYQPILGKFKAEDTDNMELYIKMRKAEKASNRTINKELDYFSGFRKWIKKKYAIPAPAERTERLPHKRPLPQILGIDEVLKILDNAEPFYRAYFLALFSLGLRMDEARQIKRKDIDFKNRLLRVIQKGGSYKILPLTDWFMGALKEISVDKLKPDTFVFLNKKTERPVLQIRKALARACKKAEITRHVYPHLFRHSVATFLMGKGINMRLIQGYMGHSKIGTTEFYTHVAVENLRDAEKVIQAAYETAKAAQHKGRSTKVKAE